MPGGIVAGVAAVGVRIGMVAVRTKRVRGRKWNYFSSIIESAFFLDNKITLVPLAAGT